MMTEADSEESAFLFFKFSVTRFKSGGTGYILYIRIFYEMGIMYGTLY
jgi:hypothetical protein